MGWHRPDEDSRADYERDARIDAPDCPAGDFDEPPLRMQPNISSAMECAVAVKNEPNFEKAARLIEDFARAEAAAERMDAVRAGAGR